jgi:hypothetical protein
MALPHNPRLHDFHIPEGQDRLRVPRAVGPERLDLFDQIKPQVRRRGFGVHRHRRPQVLR